MSRFLAPFVALPQEQLENLGRHEETGHLPVACVMAEHDFAVQGGAIGAIGLGAYLPDNAIVVGGFVEVLTTYVSATDAATIALHVQAANDIVTAVAISNGANPWDAGMKTVIPDFATVADFKKTTAKRQVIATVAVEALTAGKMRVYLFWLPSV